MRWRVWAFLAIAAACGSAEARDDVTWYAILSDSGQRLGYASYEVAPRQDGRDVIESQNLYLTEEGVSPTRMRVRTVTSEDASGVTTGIVETVQSGRSEARTEVRVDGGVARVRRQTAAGVSTHEVALLPGVRFDGGEALLRGWDPVASPQLSFDSFNLDAMRVDRIVFEAIGPRDGDGRSLRRAVVMRATRCAASRGS